MHVEEIAMLRCPPLRALLQYVVRGCDRFFRWLFAILPVLPSPKAQALDTINNLLNIHTCVTCDSFCVLCVDALHEDYAYWSWNPFLSFVQTTDTRSVCQIYIYVEYLSALVYHYTSKDSATLCREMILMNTIPDTSERSANANKKKKIIPSKGPKSIIMSFRYTVNQNGMYTEKLTRCYKIDIKLYKSLWKCTSRTLVGEQYIVYIYNVLSICRGRGWGEWEDACKECYCFQKHAFVAKAISIQIKL